MKPRRKSTNRHVFSSFVTNGYAGKSQPLFARLGWLLGGILCIFVTVASARMGVGGIGFVLLAVLGVFCVLRFLLPTVFESLRRGAFRVVYQILSWAIIAGIGIAVLLSGFMLFGVMHINNHPQTLVVLGTKMDGDRPCLVLERRLEAALRVLEANPDLPCVVTGGKGDDEIIAEGDGMKRWLTEHGVDPARIYTETASRNTRENFLFSHELIEKEGLSPNIGVVTDGFHQYRAGFLAKKAGFDVVGTTASSRSPWFLTAGFTVREWFAILKTWILG